MDAMIIEYCDLFDQNRVPLGITALREEKIPDGCYHLVVHVWIMDKSGKFLISKRQKGRSDEMLWERTGGSVLAGESSLDGAVREAKEELGIILNKDQAHFIKSVKREHRHDFFDSWLFIVDSDQVVCVINEKEVCEFRWVTLEEFIHLREKDEVVNSSLYFEEVYDKYKEIMIQKK